MGRMGRKHVIRHVRWLQEEERQANVKKSPPDYFGGPWGIEFRLALISYLQAFMLSFFGKSFCIIVNL